MGKEELMEQRFKEIASIHRAMLNYNGEGEEVFSYAYRDMCNNYEKLVSSITLASDRAKVAKVEISQAGDSSFRVALSCPVPRSPAFEIEEEVMFDESIIEWLLKKLNFILKLQGEDTPEVTIHLNDVLRVAKGQA